MKIKQNYKVAIYSIATIVVLFSISCGQSSKQNNQVTFTKDIAPILFKNCSPCHQKNSVGPFPLLCYEDAAKRAPMIAISTKTRYMPPWPADASYTHFSDEKLLTDAEINLIGDWVKAGCPYGDSSLLPPAPVFENASQLGKPDLVLKMERPLIIKGDKQDRFLLMKIPYQIPRDTFIRAIEFIPGNNKLLHHMNGEMVRYEYDKKKNVFDGDKIVDIKDFPTIKSAYDKLGLANDDGTYPILKLSVTNYLPGVLPNIYPEGIGGFLMSRKGAFFFKDIHYGPSAVDTSDQSQLNIFFGKGPLKRPTLELQMGTLGVSPIEPPLVIPPDSVKTFLTRYYVSTDISILTINPHMHLLGKKFWAFAVQTNGDTIPLIKINKWDFRWQYFYTFKKMVKIPEGAVIYVYGTFDNTRNNPLNPFHPPRTVSEREGSMRTTDEMFQFIITYLPYQKGDENISLQGSLK
ncbi:MAG: hypothetical protein IPP32_00690 [Bacteroidetes bacterium]|nr:hypothetical protein [Bacteroidota bacterium]